MITGEIVDCLVSYFGFDDNGEPNRYFCYHVIGGPGPTPGGGVASVVPLAIHDESERCVGCRKFHVAPTGGPAAAVDKALRYLDAYHEEDRLRKVQTALRDLSGGDGAAAARGADPARALEFLTDFTFPGRRD